MTDRLNDAPDGDLTDAEIAAANDAAEAEVEEDAAGGDTLAESEAIDEALAEADAEDLEGDEGDLEGREDEEDEEDDEAPAAATPRSARARAAAAAEARARRGSKGPRPTRTAFPIDPALRIKDPASQIFVIVTIGFFVLVFLNAMALGKGGAFTQVPTPTPIVTPSSAPTAAPSATGAPSS